MRWSGGGFKAYLPGVACSGSIEPSLTVECHPSDEPWTLDAGARGVLLANFTPGRNYFDGRYRAGNGARKTLATVLFRRLREESGRPYWLLALLDGRTQILDAAFDPVGSVASWGSDLACTEARCGGGSQVLATKAGDAREPDSLRAFALVNRTPVPLSRAAGFARAGDGVVESGRQRGARGGPRSCERALRGVWDYGELR